MTWRGQRSGKWRITSTTTITPAARATADSAISTMLPAVVMYKGRGMGGVRYAAAPWASRMRQFGGSSVSPCPARILQAAA